jgi:hypothetical protein
MFAGHFRGRTGTSIRWAWVISVAALLSVSSASPAIAAPKKKQNGGGTRLTVSPKKPKATDGLNVTFRAGKIPSDERYLVSFGDGGALPTGDARCTSGYQALVHGRQRPHKLVELTLYPFQVLGIGSDVHFVYGVQSPSARRFCAGVKTIQLSRIDPDGKVNYITGRQVRISKDSGYPEPEGTPVKVSLLDGSSIKVEAPGRPDRTLSLTGSLGGLLPAEFRPNTDLDIGSITGAMYLTSIMPDSLCAGSAYQVQLGLAPTGLSKMHLEASGNAVLTLELLAEPLSLAGCAAPANPTLVTRVTLSGRVTPDGLVKLPLNSTIQDVPIAPGLSATVTLNLLVKVDLSGGA